MGSSKGRMRLVMLGFDMEDLQSLCCLLSELRDTKRGASVRKVIDTLERQLGDWARLERIRCEVMGIGCATWIKEVAEHREEQMEEERIAEYGAEP